MYDKMFCLSGFLFKDANKSLHLYFFYIAQTHSIKCSRLSYPKDQMCIFSLRRFISTEYMYVE
jgi:hypothetical protein